MAKKKNQRKNKKPNGKFNIFSKFTLPEEVKRYIFGIFSLFLATVFIFSFFGKAGAAGSFFFKISNFLVGSSLFLLPLYFVFASLIFFFSRYQKFSGPLILATLLFIIAVSGLFSSFDPILKKGGFLGNIFSLLLFKLFGDLVTKIIFGISLVVAVFIFWNLLKQPVSPEKPKALEEKKLPSLIKKIFAPTFKVNEVEPRPTQPGIEKENKFIREAEKLPKGKTQKAALAERGYPYQIPPLDLLDSDRGQPSAGDIRQNSAVIKKTLESFEIPVEMSEINTGPTVTQYTLKPADGVKLSKITALSNDLALALASHPIRIEAPIPGKSLVGIEVPNKVRTLVRLKGLLGDTQFQQSASNLLLCLGRDVSGKPIYADLARMPHLLVAGSTGTGKTIFLNALILSLIYRNSPELLRIILIDPKRVEFPVYNDLPHLLAPVILDSQKAINSLKWLVGEMERRFDVLSRAKARDISSYNEQALKNEDQPLPYIVLIIDELADLMAARGKEIEVGIVRLAQMARAIGIHLVVATQRPSVEVITGLIKANITSRISFQVASQVDSRTVLDAAGAEKLLGWGDLLFLSAEIAKPRRLQGAYISDKEVKKVIDWIKTNHQEKILRDPEIEEEILGNNLGKNLIQSLEAPESEFNGYSTGDDPLYEEAKRVVIEARKASASLLQRRLRIGYARAARLIDILEEKGLVGPADGAKPREVYGVQEENLEERIDQ